MNIPFFVPELTKDMENAATDALRNEKFVMGESVFKFEEEFARYIGTKFAISVNSGNAALQLSLISLGINEKSKVITSTNSFIASANCILMTGAKPILCDINYDDGNIDIKSTNEKPGAIIPVHIYGNPCDFDSIKDVSETYNAPIIEDACQAHGAIFDHKKVGSIGDVGCFSFDFVKTVTCGEGGAIITNSKNLAIKADLYQDHGHDHIGNDRGAETHPYLGYNFRISELNAAVGLAQFKRLDEFLALQKKHYAILREELKPLSNIQFRTVPEGGEESYAFLNFFLPTLEIARSVMSDFKAEGIDACFHYYDNNWHYVRKWEHLKEAKSLFPLSDAVKEGLSKISTQDFSKSDHFIGRNISCLIKIGWTEEEVKLRAKKMKAIIEKF